MNKITVNVKALESMLFIWASIKDREKVSDLFLTDLAESPEMEGAIEEEFDKRSIVKVLSAISNRERLNAPTKKESRFWNYNMWMLEDPETTNNMLKPVKQLNLDDLADENTKEGTEVIFFPGHFTTMLKKDNKLFINFFAIKTDMFDPSIVTIEDKPLKEFIKENL